MVINAIVIVIFSKICFRYMHGFKYDFSKLSGVGPTKPPPQTLVRFFSEYVIDSGFVLNFRLGLRSQHLIGELGFFIYNFFWDVYQWILYTGMLQQIDVPSGEETFLAACPCWQDLVMILTKIWPRCFFAKTKIHVKIRPCFISFRR